MTTAAPHPLPDAPQARTDRAPDPVEAYPQLRRMAHRRMSRQPSDHTLDATSLVHEVYLKLLRHKDRSWRDRAHFFRAAAQTMYSILADRARRQFRRSGRVVLELDGLSGDPEPTDDRLDLQALVVELSDLDPRAARIAEKRLLRGMSVRDVARDLQLSPRQVHRDWAATHAWLRHRLQGGGPNN